MRGTLVVMVAALAAPAGCQPLYGDAPETLKKPARTQAPLDPEADAGPPVVVVDACSTNTHRPYATVKRDTAQADTAVQRGRNTLGPARAEADPKKKTARFLTGLGEYRSALTSDPYHADATLELAVAYDELHYKGCALTLLTRIGEMQTNSRYADDANRVADAVRATSGWFLGYRTEALKAVNR